VDADDQLRQSALVRGGAQLLVDYGAFALWQLPSAAAPVAYAVAPDALDTIELRDLTIDTAAPSVAPQRSRAIPSAQLWMLQFIGPPKDEWLDAVRGQGVEVVSYLPNNAYVVWGEADALNALQAFAATAPFVQWNGSFAAHYKLAPSLRALQGDDQIDITVQVYPTAQEAATLGALQALGPTLLPPWRVLNLTNLAVRVPAAAVARIAARPDVFNVEPYSAPRMQDERQGQIVAGNLERVGERNTPSGPGYLEWLASKGFPNDPARYPLIDVVDDGLDGGDAEAIWHPDFYEAGDRARPDRVVSIANCTSDPRADGASGHGTINAGILAGYNNTSGSLFEDEGGYQYGLGVAPWARINATKIFRNNDGFELTRCGGNFAGLSAQSAARGAAITSNSWAGSPDGLYDAMAQAYDALTRDAAPGTPGSQPMLHVFAGGNGGTSSGTVASPGTAKNVLTVGATENVRAQGIADGCGWTEANNADDLATYSGRGPTRDGRAKPDTVAPGTHITGLVPPPGVYTGNTISCSEPSEKLYYPPGQERYTWSTGTSQATPAAAGAAGLAYEYYGRVLAPGQQPSPAMLKALLLGSARYLNGVGAADTLPGAGQGWGALHLAPLFDGTPRRLVDQQTVLRAPGESFELRSGVADSRRRLQVTLAWTDAPGPTVGSAYVNNLDLEVRVGGQLYRGNVFSRGASVTGGAADTRNNVEQVLLPPGLSGPVTVRVLARTLGGDGVPDDGDKTDQDFALVVGNVSDAPRLTASPLRWNETRGNDDGVLDPGEEGTLAVELNNVGAGAASNLSGTLSGGGVGVTLLPSAAAYPNLASGERASASFPLSVAPTQACGATLSFTQTIQSAQGPFTTTFDVLVGRVETSAPLTISYSGPSAAIPDNAARGASLSLPISATGTISDVDVLLSIVHPFAADLDLFLVAPDGSEVELSTHNGSYAAGDKSYRDTIFDDAANKRIDDRNSEVPFTGRFRPEGSLAALNGKAAAGTWQLRVVDTAQGDAGSVTEFALVLRTATTRCTPFSASPTATPTSATPTTPVETPPATATATSDTTAAPTATSTTGSSPTATPRQVFLPLIRRGAR
jgi:subtilisin-like proprotein convertase family protein